MFRKASRKKSKARVALAGVSGSGKTYTALAIACALGKRVLVVDSERGSAEKYAGQFEFDVVDAAELPDHSPATYHRIIAAAAQEQYDVMVVDSLSHEWMGAGGILEMVDKAGASGTNRFAPWRTASPLHAKLVDALLQVPFHLICTMRSKAEYVMETNDRGKQVPRKIGMAPVQRDGIEFEFDIFGSLDLDHNLTIEKTRCPLLDGKVFHKPGSDVAAVLRKWMDDGVELPKPAAPATAPPKAATTTAFKHPMRNQIAGMLKELAGITGAVTTANVGILTELCNRITGFPKPDAIPDAELELNRDLVLDQWNAMRVERDAVREAADAARLGVL